MHVKIYIYINTEHIYIQYIIIIQRVTEKLQFIIS